MSDIELLKQLYAEGRTPIEISVIVESSEKSIIARLASAGVYEKKVYLTKQGTVPVLKSLYVEQIADLLDVNVDLLSSLEKCNKSVLQMIVKALDP